MLSICIPVFNVDVRPLVQALDLQRTGLTESVEIILIDDASTLFKEENRSLENIAQWIELEQNIGRSRIRNLFLEYAKEEYLLFLDCDVLIDNANFISNYLTVVQEKPGVVCGGHRYPEQKPKKEELLRWKYGRLKESKSATERQLDPNKSFMTNNFAIQKEILHEIKFDERLRNYGHEDTLFGIQLKKKHIAILHIDNSVLIGDSEKNEHFLQKTEMGVKNLVKILQFKEYSNELWNEIALLRFYKKVQVFGFIIYPVFKLTKKMHLLFLRQGNISLNCFDFFKLGTLMEALRSKAS